MFPEKIAFDSASRLLLIAAHPDDEALGCSIVLQRAVRAGASVQVVYATDGENNPWPQRLIARKWRLDARDRKRWGRLRRIEALKALSVLGVAASNARFLGWPDQGLTNLLASNARSAIGVFTRIIRDWSPTHLLVPSIADTHPDHSALGILLRLALAELFPAEVDVSVWTYAIHGVKRSSLEHVGLDRQSPSETAGKMDAIECHRTQLRLSHKRFLAYAERPERFIRLAAEEPLASGLIRSFSNQPSSLCLILRRSIRTIFTRPMLFLFGQGATETLRCVAIRPSIGSARRVEMRDIGNGRRVGFARYQRRGFAGRLIIPTDIFCSTRALFVKVKRARFRFFDEAGWLEIAAITGALPAQASTLVPALSPANQVEFARQPPIRPTADIRPRNSVQNRRWAVVFAAVFLALAAVFLANINRPWTDMLDFNGAVWSQSAHNILRAGLAQTSGASSGFYFGPLPIPPWGYYLHHPPLLHLAVTALFAVFGEHEWVARLLPIGCSLTSVVLLWSLVCSCAGSRTATLSAAVFASLPMELRYGQMVNFEPCVLMLILGALLCLRYWHLSGDPLWKHGALGLIFVGFWVDWAMYLFGVSLCLWFGQSRKGRRFAWTLLIVALLSAAFYLVRIRLLRPDAWENLSHTFVVRLGSSGTDRFTELQWISRVFNSLLAHFFVLNWMLAAAGAAIVLRDRLWNEGSRWLLRASICVIVMDAIFVGVFQNDSYIHQYISFYFVAPVAILAGIAIDRLITFLQGAFFRNELAFVGEVSACLLMLTIGIHGVTQTKKLQQQFRILDSQTPEPVNLIPELGSEVRKDFPPGTRVLCNFLPDYGPQFAYYAQRDLVNNLSEYQYWQRFLKDPSKPVGGVIWMGSKSAHDLVTKLPPGKKRFFNVGHFSFCFWNRNQLATK